jgi:peptidoglycan hydrolase-like protein with peptidoglycan-binding domain
MYSGFKQLGRFTLSAALALGLVGITGSARVAWAQEDSGAQTGDQTGSQASQSQPSTGSTDQNATPNPQSNTGQTGATSSSPSDNQAPMMNPMKQPSSSAWSGRRGHIQMFSMTRFHSPASVRRVQLRLRDAGYYKGRIDGNAGPETRAALRRFQRDKGLRATGMLTHHRTVSVVTIKRSHGQAGRSMITSVHTCTGCMQEMHSRATLRTAQRMLRTGGYYKGRVDGIAGPETHAAIRRFQRANGLTVTGRLTPGTMSKLGVKHSSGAASRSQSFNENTGPSGSITMPSQPQQSQNSMPSTQPDSNVQATQPDSSQQDNMASREDTSSNAAVEQPDISPSTVRSVQTNLQQQGLYSGEVNGVLDPQTREAIRKFQRTQNLNDTGRLDQQTLSRLGVN